MISKVLELWGMCSSAKGLLLAKSSLFHSLVVAKHPGATGNIDSQPLFMLRYQCSTAGYILENIKPPQSS